MSSGCGLWAGLSGVSPEWMRPVGGAFRRFLSLSLCPTGLLPIHAGVQPVHSAPWAGGARPAGPPLPVAGATVPQQTRILQPEPPAPQDRKWSKNSNILDVNVGKGADPGSAVRDHETSETTPPARPRPIQRRPLWLLNCRPQVDSSPYSSAYLSPPPDPSWRR